MPEGEEDGYSLEGLDVPQPKLTRILKKATLNLSPYTIATLTQQRSTRSDRSISAE